MNKLFTVSLLLVFSFGLIHAQQTFEEKESLMKSRAEHVQKVDYNNLEVHIPENTNFSAQGEPSTPFPFESKASLEFAPIKIENTNPDLTPRWTSTKIQLQAAESPEAYRKQALEVALKNLKLPYKTDELELKKNKKSAEELHLYYQATHQGVPIYANDFHVHIKQDEIYAVYNTTTPVEADISPNPTFDLQSSIEKGYETINMERKTYQMPLLPEDKSELVYYKDQLGQWHLAYHLTLHPNIHHRKEVFIDAHSGKEIFQFESLCRLHDHTHDTHEKAEEMPPVRGSGRDLSGTTRQINTFEQGGTHYLIDASRPMYNASASTIPDDPKGAIVTLDLRNNPLSQNAQIFHVTNNSNSWNNHETAISAHYNAGESYEYFRQTFNRNSLDGNGGTILSIINVTEDNGTQMDNAFWNGVAMFYGNGSQAFDPLVLGFDVAGHEMTHGVIQNEANLEYMNESGAINESFADVFGAMIDREDWLIGEDVVRRSAFPSGALRNMMDPHNGGSRLGDPGYQPNHYDERFTGTQNNGGVHINSGIGNRAYYLFATDVGKDFAEQVYYRALTTYLGRRSNYADLREAIIQSVEDQSGHTQAQIDAAKNAFNAVGIGEGSGSNTSGGYSDINVNPGSDLILHTNERGTGMNLVNAQAEIIASNVVPQLSRNKPSITDDGSLIVFIDQNYHLSYVEIDWAQSQVGQVQTLEITSGGQMIEWSNAAISKDGRLLALVPREDQPIMVVIDLAGNNNQVFDLYNPTTSSGGNTTEGVVGADALEFDHSGEYIIYDAFNQNNSSGFNEEYWNINILNVWSNQSQQFTEGNIIPLYASLPDGVSIGNPSFSKNSTGVLAFDFLEEGFLETNYSLLAVDLSTNSTNTLFENVRLSYPSYSRDDRHILFDAETQDGDEVVAIMELQSDKVNAAGEAALFVGGYWGVWFSNGQRDLVNTIQSEDNDILNIYPNPVKAQLTIESDDNNTIRSIQLLDLLGKVHLQTKTENQQLQIDMEAFSSGLYIIRVETDKGVIQKQILKP